MSGYMIIDAARREMNSDDNAKPYRTRPTPNNKRYGTLITLPRIVEGYDNVGSGRRRMMNSTDY